MHSKLDYVTNYPLDLHSTAQPILLNPTHLRTPPISPPFSHQSLFSMRQALSRSEPRLKAIQLKFERMKKLMKMVSDRVGLDSSSFLEEREEKWDELQGSGKQDIRNNSLGSRNNSVGKGGRKWYLSERKAEILKEYNQASKQGMSLSRFCVQHRLPERTVRRWITKR